MIDIKLIRENRDIVKENIKKKFQDEKLPLVDEVFEMDVKVREAQTKADNLKAEKNKMSGEIGKLMKDKKIDEANEIKAEIAKMAEEITALEATQAMDSLLTNAGTGSGELAKLFDLGKFMQQIGLPIWLVTFLGDITGAIYRTITYSGVQILVFLAAIQSVPGHLYEAAKIEGATAYESFWKITLPMVSPQIITVVVYTIVDSFLRSGINDIIDYQYTQAFYGKHAAMSWIYVIASVLILAIAVGILNKVVFYQDDKK